MVIGYVNNPRKSNGDFGDFCCTMCDNYSSAYLKVSAGTSEKHETVLICKGCLLRWVGHIDKIILNDVVQKGIERSKNV